MNHSQQVLLSNIRALENQQAWLLRSYNLCKEITLKDNYLPEEMDALETLCSRFSRSIDYLIRKVFRSIDDVEFENQGTLIDIINHAEKRGLIKSVEQMRTLKEIRNEIVHEYIQEGLQDLFSDVLTHTPLILDMIEKTIHYCHRYRD